MAAQHTLTAVAALAMTVVLAGCDGAAQDAPSPTTTAPAAVATATAPAMREAGVEREITYCTAGGIELRMDLYHPGGEAAPVVVYLHGGAWLAGHRGNPGGPLGVDFLLERGYAVASVDYRLAPQHPFPAQIEDARCAVRHLRAHAGRHGIDPERIAAWGGSAGGHLAALLGTAADEAGFDSGAEHADESNAVQAVVSMYGPADLEAPDFLSIADRAAREVFGAEGPGPSEALRRASPVTYASADDPPFFIVHGVDDVVVPLSQSLVLAARLREAGVDVTLAVVENAGHSLRATAGEPEPGLAEIRDAIAEFLDRVLGR